MSDPRARLRRTIFGQCRRLGYNEAKRHEIQVTICGFESMKDATKDALVKMVNHLVKRGAPIDPPKVRRIGTRRPVKDRPKGRYVRMVTVRQRQLIANWAQWKNLSTAYVRGVSRRMFGHDSPQTTKEASALIVSLSSDRIPAQNNRTIERKELSP